MIVTLVRMFDDGKRTIGKIFIDGVFECYTLEDTYRATKVKGQTRIPCGSYRLELRHSPKFTPIYKHEMIWVKDVLGFEFILFHPGNSEGDTDGCILVGRQIYKNEVLTSSKAAYQDLYPKIANKIKSGTPVQFAVVDYDR